MKRRSFLQGLLVATAVAFLPLGVRANPQPSGAPPVFLARPQTTVEDLEREMAAWVAKDPDDHDKVIQLFKQEVLKTPEYRETYQAPWCLPVLPGKLSVVSGRVVVRF